MILLLISFVAGILTVLAPCILPVLPVIVGGSISTDKNRYKKALTIIISLGVSILLFTFLLKASTLLIEIPEDVWKWISGGIIILFGLVTLFPNLWNNKHLAKLSAKSNIALGKGNKKDSFWGDVTIGAALGPVFSTCSPTYFIVLATVLPVSIALGFVYLLAYVLGLGLILFLIVMLGQRLVAKLNIAANPNSKFKKLLGALFILLGFAIIAGLDKELEVKLIESNLFDVTQVEQKLLELNQ
jgi:cytochrome c-type biogenesis protein